MKKSLKLILIALLLVTQAAYSQNQRKYTPAEIAINPFGQKKSVLQDFMDDGGINRHNSWWGLTLVAFNMRFDGKDESTSVLVNTISTIKEVRNAGNILCGFKDGDWARRNDPDGKVLLDAENKFCKAGIDNFVAGEGIVTLSITRK